MKPALCLLPFTLALMIVTLRACAGAETASLREYGTVTAAFGPNHAEFDCQNAGKADLLLGKLLADLFWDAGDAHRQTMLRVGLAHVVVHVYPPYGMIVVGRAGSRVVAVGADTEAQMRNALAGEPLLTGPDTQFSPQKPYPIALDFYDLRAFRAYIATPQISTHGFGINSHWPFLQKFGMNAAAFQQPGFNFFCPAPGVVDWAGSDSEIRDAERQGGMAMPSFETGGVAPLWFYNKYPGSRAQPSPTTLLGSWGKVAGAGDHFESWFTPDTQREEGDFAFERQVMARYGTSSAVGGWQIYAGQPGVEMGNHGLSTEFFDYSAAGQAGFRRWLQTARGDSLASLGRRWFGDSKHYRRWEEVAVPDVNAFFGSLDADALRLTDHWQRRPALPQEGNSPSDAAGWVSVVSPPSQQQAFLPWQPAWYRCTFDAEAWRKRWPQRNSYLVCNINNRSQAGISVWLNGSQLGVFKPESGCLGLNVTGLLKSGPNTLLLKIPTGGKLIGPVFLSHSPPRVFPFLGSGRNAQYADFKDWQAYGIFSYHKGIFEEARRLDPERPLLLATDDLGSVGDYAAALAAGYGMGIENTGREAYYAPWWPGLALADGFYATSEPSAVPTGSNLDRMMSWILFDGDGAHQLFRDVEDFQQREKDDGWFTRNRRRIQLFGKSLRVPPSIALLWPVRTSRLGSSLPWSWDIGRGELEAAHYDNVYLTEREVQSGQAQAYPVLFDGGTALLDPMLAAALRKYVEAGGTYVALHNTGQYTTFGPDSRPLAALTGFQVWARGKRGPILFGRHLPLFTEWQGRQFDGEGSALDWKNNQTAQGVGLALKPVAPDAVPLARWADGSVAVGYRRLGKGRVILLGSTFWRSGKDTAGVWLPQSAGEGRFFQTLFTALGIRRNARSDSPDVWTRKSVTKNGLQDWLIACNNADADRAVNVALQVGLRPREVVDMLTNQPVPFTYTPDGWVHVPNVTVAALQTRIFGVRRAGLVAGLPVWWGEKTRYWKRIVLAPKPPRPAASFAAPEAIAFDSWNFVPGTGGVGQYRASFHVPTAWAGHAITLGLYSFNTPIVYGAASFFVNGRLVASYQAHGGNQTLGYDVTDALQPGDNVLSVEVTAAANAPASGALSGAVWIAPERLLSPSLTLDGPWEAIGGDGSAQSKVTAPAAVTARNLAQRVTLPSAWQGKEVFVHLETPDQCISAVVVNGHPIVCDSYAHPFGTRAEVNVTLYLRAGLPNCIELWPRSVLPAGDGSVRRAEDTLRLTHVSLGCEAGKSNPLFGSQIRPEDAVEPEPVSIP